MALGQDQGHSEALMRHAQDSVSLNGKSCPRKFYYGSS